MNRARSRCLALLALAAATAWAPAPAGAQSAWPPPPPAPAYPGWPPPPAQPEAAAQPVQPAQPVAPLPEPPAPPPQPAWPVRPPPHVRRARPVQPVPQVIEEASSPPKPETWQGSLGMRATFIRSTGFDAFSDNDVLSQISLGIQYVLARRDALAFAVGAAGDFGGRDATARSAPSSMSLSRYTAIAEGRYQFWQRGYAFLRFAPGLLRGSARVEDSSVPGSGGLEDRFNLPAVDASAGAALRLSGTSSQIAAWFTADGGYGWAASHHLLLAPSAAARDQAKLAPLDLGTIDPRGFFMRFALAVAY